MAALDVSKELQPESLTLAGTGDQPWHVSDGEHGGTGRHDS